MSTCTLRGSPWRARLIDDVRARLFTAGGRSDPEEAGSAAPAGAGAGVRDGRTGRTRFGVEAELIPLDAATGHPVGILGETGGALAAGGAAGGTLAFLRQHGAPRGWRVVPGPHGVPSFLLPGGGRVAYEPGGQIEYATPPHDTVADAASDLERVLPPLVAEAEGAGIRLVGRGIDPVNGLDRSRLLLPGDRYVAMHRYLSRIGDAGPRMMRQTAAIQVNVELADPDGRDAALRWRVLNAAAPFLTAIFANSATYAGEDTGFASFRARQWRLLDRRRTGVLGREEDAAAEYVDFGLEAGWIFDPRGGAPEPFVEGLLRGEATLEDWRRHLTTLFPEIRPRGYLEVRSIDALPPEWSATPLAVVAGLLADAASLREAAEIAGGPDSALLQDAARKGLSDPHIARGAAALFELALAAGERARILHGDTLDRARAYYHAYTARGRSPGEEAVGAAA